MAISFSLERGGIKGVDCLGERWVIASCCRCCIWHKSSPQRPFFFPPIFFFCSFGCGMYNNCHLKIEEERGEREEYRCTYKRRSIPNDRLRREWLPAVSSSTFFFMTKGQKVTRFFLDGHIQQTPMSMRRWERLLGTNKRERERGFSQFGKKRGRRHAVCHSRSHSLFSTDHFSLFRPIFFQPPLVWSGVSGALSFYLFLVVWNGYYCLHPGQEISLISPIFFDWHHLMIALPGIEKKIYII